MAGEDRTDWQLHKLTVQAVEAGLLIAGSPGHETTLQVIRRGFDSLSPTQRLVFLAEAVPAINEMMQRQFPPC
jgi:hypothetical protein